MRTISLFFGVLFCFACQKEKALEADVIASTENDLNTNSDNGYSKTKTVNGYKVMVSYLPNENINNITSPNEIQDKSLHFLMEIETDGNRKSGNFLYHDVYGLEDFKSNVNYFNFSIIEDVSVAVNGTPFNMVLSNMENIYTLGDSRKIHFVAVPPSPAFEETSIQQISFVYDDAVLGIGTTKFTFHTEDFKPIPNKI